MAEGLRLCALVVCALLALGSCRQEQVDVQPEESGYYRREHSLVQPYQGRQRLSVLVHIFRGGTIQSMVGLPRIGLQYYNTTEMLSLYTHTFCSYWYLDNLACL